MGIFQQFPYSNFHEMNLDEIIKIVRHMLDEWAQYYDTWDDWKEQVTQEWSEMQSFINNYFDNLDVQTEINNKITAMVTSGEFGQIVDPYIPPEVSAWLAEHITTPETVVIDDSLSIAGAAADAKATGDEIADLKSDLGARTYNIFSCKNNSVLGSRSVLTKVTDNDFSISPSSPGSSVSTPVIFSLMKQIETVGAGKKIAVSGSVSKNTGAVPINIGVLSGTTFTPLATFNNIPNNFYCEYTLTESDVSDHTGKVMAVRFYGSLNAEVTAESLATYSDVMVAIDEDGAYLPYYTANDAVARNEIAKAEPYFDEQTAMLGQDTIELTAGYVACNANPVDATLVTFSRSWKHAVIPCQAGDLFTITATGGHAARAFAFIDADGTILAFSGANKSVTNLCIKAPTSATKLIINDSSGSISRYGDTSEDYTIWRNDIAIAGKSEKVIRTGAEQYAIQSSGLLRTTSSRTKAKFFEIDRDKTYIIRFVGGDLRRIGFVDSGYTMYSAVYDYTDYGNAETVRIKVTSTHPIMGIQYTSGEDIDGDVYITELSTRELQLNDKITRIMQNDYDVSYANAAFPLMMKSYMGNNMNVHPSVKYFPNGLFGHRFWMAYTPYPLKNTYRENPCIAFSEDGYDWTNIAANPLDTPHGSSSNYNSDTHLVYNPNTGKLECWYRFADVVNTQEIIYRKTSSDGLTWSEREELNRSENGLIKTLSPAVIYDSDNSKYQIWVVNDKEKRIDYYESTTGDNWVFIKSLTLSYQFDSKTYDVWHIDVELINGDYVILAMSREHGTTGYDYAHLFITQSADNDTYTTPQVVIKGREDAWDSSIYRACLVEVDNQYRIYYSALNGQIYAMGITESNTLSNFIGAFH